MKPIHSIFLKTAAVCSITAIVLSGTASLAGHSPDPGQEKNQAKDKQSAPSDAEQKALAKIESSPDVAAKLAAAGEFVKKFPKSSLRSKVVGYLGQEINKIQDGPQRISQLESMLT